MLVVKQGEAGELGAGRRTARGWLDEIVPGVCVLCGRPLGSARGLVCGLCWSRAPEQGHPRCWRCGIALRDLGIGFERERCTDCSDWLPYLREARAPFVMSGTAALMVHALKYGGWRELADEMGGRMAATRFSRRLGRELCAVVPIPLSRSRLRERGFNQAGLLAAVVARSWSLPFHEGSLARVRETRRQARLSTGERSRNVAGAFAVRRSWSRAIRGSHLLLVDDVLTTGHTARDCVRALCQAGARSASVLTFARARPELGDRRAAGGLSVDEASY